MYGGAPSAGIGTSGGGGGSGSGGRGRGGGRTWPSTTSVSSSGKRIQKEMTELSMEAPPDCAAGPKGDNLYHWVATIFGPPGIPQTAAVKQILRSTLSALSGRELSQSFLHSPEVAGHGGPPAATTRRLATELRTFQHDRRFHDHVGGTAYDIKASVNTTDAESNLSNMIGDSRLYGRQAIRNQSF
ncbi:Constitutive photomorphogenesis protein 10 [Capsicum annuum]|nr:Constitutive photomorphogenesis protein 10 [Capsicum annuum]